MFFTVLYSTISSPSGNLQQNRSDSEHNGHNPATYGAHIGALQFFLSSAPLLESNYSRWRKPGQKFGVTKCMRGGGGGGEMRLYGMTSPGDKHADVFKWKA